MPALALARGAADQGHDVVLVGASRGIEAQILPRHPFPGLTTRLLARGARQVHLGFPEARLRLAPGKRTQVFVFGNPITPPGPMDARAARVEFGLPAEGRTILVFGGSQGARALNETIARVLQHGLLGDVNLLWGTGATHVHRYAPLAVPGRVVVQGFFDPIGSAYVAANLVVARAGAMTVSELCAWGKASVLVPLPTAAADHQTFNARALANAGASVLLLEREFTAEAFSKTVVPLAHDDNQLDALARSARGRGHPNAARTILEKVLELSQVA